MKILIPPSEGKAKIKPQNIKFCDTKFIYERSVKQVVRLLNLIDNEDLRSIYGTSLEKVHFHEIGSLDERWNWLEGWTSGHNKDQPYAVHYTRGGPWFSEWQDVEFAKEWLEERDEYLSNKFKS